MKSLPEHMVAEAFALSTARGAELLARLGTFRVWEGDLPTMRGDSPRVGTPTEEPEAVPPPRSLFFDTLVLARAIELLQPICRAALAAVYAEHKDTAGLAADLDTEPVYAQRLLTTCEQRLLEIYNSLAEASSDRASVPQWVSDREHAAADGSRRR